jgi:hypothetical protein
MPSMAPQRYLSEFRYPFNRRFKPRAEAQVPALQDRVPRLSHAEAYTRSLPYRLLTGDGLAG